MSRLHWPPSAKKGKIGRRGRGKKKESKKEGRPGFHPHRVLSEGKEKKKREKKGKRKRGKGGGGLTLQGRGAHLTILVMKPTHRKKKKRGRKRGRGGGRKNECSPCRPVQLLFSAVLLLSRKKEVRRRREGEGGTADWPGHEGCSAVVTSREREKKRPRKKGRKEENRQHPMLVLGDFSPYYLLPP